MVRRRAEAFTAVGILLACLATTGCSGRPMSAPGTATVPTAPMFTTTTMADPYAIPATIDAAYVNRVLAALDAVNGEVVRAVYTTKSFPGEAAERLRAMYVDGPSLDLALRQLQNDILGGFKNYQANPGNQVTLAMELITVRSDCLFVRVDRDYSNVAVTPNPSTRNQWLAFKPLDSKRDPKKFNPTPWMYVYEGYAPGHLRPSDPCVDS